MRILTLFPIFASNQHIVYACQALVEAFQDCGAEVQLFVTSSREDNYRPYHRYGIPTFLKGPAYRLFPHRTLDWITEARFPAALRPGDVAHIWPSPACSEVYRRAKGRGNMVVTEFVNTHRATGERILEAEANRIGIAAAAPDVIRQRIRADELRCEFADFIFSPSPEVTKSIIAAGVSPHKVIQSSLGMRPSDVLPARLDAPRPGRKPKGIFVGSIGMRKGVHLLLDYWSKAKIDGTLSVVGAIEPETASMIEPMLRQPGVEYIAYTKDLASVYADADVFLLPSLEEGSPLVTYLALGAGMPSIVSPMGAGGVIQDGSDGMVIEPHDADAWIAGMKTMFSNAELRRTYGANAYAKAPYYVWSELAKRRYAQLLERLPTPSRA
ncbi:MAG: glycosyltransferase family 4 protein [Hyphomicrobium sp.]